MYLYAKTNSVNGYAGSPTYGSNNATLLQKIVSTWSIPTVNFNNLPAITTASQKILPTSTSTAQNYVVDMTDFVQSWVNKPDSNFGVLFRLQTEQYYNSMIFHSGQAPEELRPRLEICYTLTSIPPPDCSNSLVIRGDRINGKYTQLYMDNRSNTNNADQIELAEAETGNMLYRQPAGQQQS